MSSAWIACLALAATPSPWPIPGGPADVLRMHAEGATEFEMLQALNRVETNFAVTEGDVLRLRAYDVPESVVRAVIALGGRRFPPAAPAPPPSLPAPPASDPESVAPAPSDTDEPVAPTPAQPAPPPKPVPALAPAPTTPPARPVPRSNAAATRRRHPHFTDDGNVLLGGGVQIVSSALELEFEGSSITADQDLLLANPFVGVFLADGWLLGAELRLAMGDLELTGLTAVLSKYGRLGTTSPATFFFDVVAGASSVEDDTTVLAAGGAVGAAVPIGEERGAVIRIGLHVLFESVDEAGVEGTGRTVTLGTGLFFFP